MRKFLILVCGSLCLAGQCYAGKMIWKTPSDPGRAYPKFHIGVSGINATVEKGLLVTVDSTEPGTPAEGKFQKGDILVTVNGKPLSDPEPYVALGNALTAAEAGDGKLVFTVKRGDKEESVTIAIPVLGAYSKTWPLDCKKSDTIVRQAAEFLSQPDKLGERYNWFGGLFLLSTGDDKYLPFVKAMVDLNSPDKAGTMTWENGYAGVLIGEYYLRTGDKSALPRLKALCVDAKERQYNGGWNHWGNPGLGYVQGGLMNPAGVQILTSLILAKECGVEVDQGTFDRALTLFYRFAGHEAVPYGDQHPEGWLGGDGKDGMLAAALSLLDGKAYQAAAQTMSLAMADSYRWLGHGHGSSFGDHIWRGLGSVHVPEDRQANYRRSLEKLTWYYDLCRRPEGGFSLLNLGANVEEKPVWGHGLALVYTAPRKTLRITGAPHTKYSKKVRAPDRPWGQKRDLDFLRTDYCEGFGKEELEPHEVYDKLGDAYNNPNEKVDKAFCVKMMRHYNPTARRQAAQALGRMGATNELAQALQDPDPRVRRAALEGITGYRGFWGNGEAAFPPAVVSEKFLPSILKILKDKKSSLWELQGALLALGMAELDDVTANLAQVRKYLGHEEWWLRQAALVASRPLSKDEQLVEPLLPLLFDCLTRETHEMPRRNFVGYLNDILKDKEMSGGIKQEVVAGMRRAMHDTVIEPGLQGEIGRHKKLSLMQLFVSLPPDEFVYIMDDIVARIDAWGAPAFVAGSEIGLCEGAVKQSLALGEKARPLMERIAKAYVENRATRRGMRKVGDGIRKYEEQYGKLKNSSEAPLVAETRDTGRLKQGLIGYWQFDEGAGAESADSSGRNNKAVLKGGAGWADGLIGKALQAGKGQLAEVPGYKDPLTNGRIENLSVSYWIRTAHLGSARVGKGKETDFFKDIANWFISFWASGAGWDVCCWDNVAVPFFTATFDNKPHGMGGFGDGEMNIPRYMWQIVDDGKTWHHVVAVYDGSRKALSLYVDGFKSGVKGRFNPRGLEGLDKENHIVPALDDLLTFGGKFEKDEQVESFDEIAIWDRAITDAEVEILYNNGFGAVIK